MLVRINVVSKRMRCLFVACLRLQSSHVALPPHTVIMHPRVHWRMVLLGMLRVYLIAQCVVVSFTTTHAQIHNPKADDREKAKEFVKRYDKSMANPETKAQVHRVSHYLASGELGSDLRAYAKGDPMSERLRTEITAYQLCMLDDSVQESPHAKSTKVVQAARASKPPWWSATVRMQQNIDLMDALEAKKPQRFAQFFHSWKFLCQTSRSSKATWRLTPKRVGDKPFLQKVYRLGHENRIDWSALGLLSATDSGRPMSGAKLKPGYVHHLLLDLLKRVCQPGFVFSVCKPSAVPALDTLGNGGPPLRRMPSPGMLVYFQVVCLNVTRKKQVHTEQVHLEKKFALPAMVQFWHATDPHEPSSRRISVRPDNIPDVIDLLDIAGDACIPTITKSLTQWTLASSSTGSAGHLDIVNPIKIDEKQWPYLYVVALIRCDSLNGS
jgi:hypothetical protein